MPLDGSSQGLKLHRSKHGQIPYHHFKIEGESYMCTQLDLDELASYEEVLASLNSVEWMDAMKEEMSSMIRKHV